MATFKFRLQSVLKHRHLIEDQRQRELAMILRQRMVLIDQLRLTQQSIGQSKRDLSQALVGKVNMEKIGHFARFSGQGTQRARQIVQKLAVLEQQAVAARQALANAMRDRKALELLRERQLEAWRRQQDRLEAAELDELAVQSYARGNMARGAS